MEAEAWAASVAVEVDEVEEVEEVAVVVAVAGALQADRESVLASEAPEMPLSAEVGLVASLRAAAHASGQACCC